MAKTEENKVVNEPTEKEAENVTLSKTEFEGLISRLEKLEKAEEEKQEAQKTSLARKVEDDKKLNEKVKIKLFKDGEKYKDDVFVCINGRAIRIKRGVEVEIPRAYAEVLDQAMIQSIKTAELIEEETQKANW